MRIYVIAAIQGKYNKRIANYRVLDIDSGELKEVNKKSLIEAINKNSWVFKNVKVGTDNELIVHEGNKLPLVNTEGRVLAHREFIIISIDEEKGIFKIAKFNGEIFSTTRDDIYYRADKLAGLPDKYKSRPREITPNKNQEFIDKIDELYKEFILRTRAIGLDCAFKYRVYGEKVTLEAYEGSSIHAIVPKFVTIIDNLSFYRQNITKLSLNDGLKLIGERAFAANNIDEVDIPKTVTCISKYAFRGNSQLFKRVLIEGKYDEEIDKEKFRVYSKNIDILHQI